MSVRNARAAVATLAICAVAGGTAVAHHSVIRGTTGPDTLNGGPGRDRIHARAGNDTVHGNGGRDRIWAGRGEDMVFGDAGRDRIWVRDGERDVVDCGDGRDRVVADQLDALTNCERRSIRNRKAPGDRRARDRDRDDDRGDDRRDDRDDGGNSGPGR